MHSGRLWCYTMFWIPVTTYVTSNTFNLENCYDHYVTVVYVQYLFSVPGEIEKLTKTMLHQLCLAD